MLWCLAHGRCAAALIALVPLYGCSPTLDWREVRPEGSGVVALFPCKPSTDIRMVTLAGARVRMLLTACSAGDATWALAAADVGEPARVAPALATLRLASADNLGAAASAVGTVSAMQVSGMTPNSRAERIRVQGRVPGGDAVMLDTGFFVKGTWIFQATVMSAKPEGEAVTNFFDNLRLPS